ncbi:PD-(D/E)XK nuclease family protein [Blattabacterium cuenoti]|uniref:PD-(D/E)XK nuclease family protein n=1 Tax=Blattabacterium cuenoti TaxID=1653831 RepID=UPI00163C878F|nr:PD-(D/E)XK nuclease family protein [Blattabacterium cuenoti]
MKRKIDQIIRNLLFNKKINNNTKRKKLILTSINNPIIEYIKNKYQSTIDNTYVSFLRIEKFLEIVSGLHIVDNNYLLLYLFYSLNNKVENKFSSYLRWGPKILNDFKIIDYEIMDKEKFFSSMISTEKIKKWNPNIPFLKEKNNFLYWEKIYEYYNILQSELLKRGFAYKEMIFKLLIINNQYLDHFFYKNADTIIVLFFIENLIYKKYTIKHLLNKITQFNQGLIYDISAVDNNKFIEKNYFLILKKEKNKLDNLEVISVSKEIEQVKIIEDIIESKKIYKNKILIVLGDKYLFTPLFYSINRKYSNISINIDYPLKMISIHYTIYSIFQLLLKKNKYQEFNKKDVIRLLSDVYIKKFFFQKDYLLKILNKEENKSNFISKNDIINKYLSNNDLRFIFEIQDNDSKKIFTNILFFIRKMKNFLKEKITYIVEYQFLSNLENYIQKIKIIFRRKKNLFFGIKDIFTYYEQFINTEKIRYQYVKNGKKNNELCSITITGFMDIFFDNFDTTIVTSFNEGIIPSYNRKNNYSFIPFDIRKKLGIDHNNENYYFYYFINILRSSKKIFLTYKNQSDELNSGEKSRFIHQIERISNISIKQKNFPFIPKNNFHAKPIIIKKTKSIIKILDRLSYQGFSPSSIYLYNYNPILFYYKKILGVNYLEKTSIKQKIGKIIHQALEMLYLPLKGKLMTLDLIQSEIRNKSECIIKKIFYQKDNNYPLTESEILLYYRIIKNYVDNFVSLDEKNVKNGHRIFIKEIECNISTILNIRLKKVKLHGIIDRIDEYNGEIRIIDYKIGFSKKKEMNILLSDIENIFSNTYYSNVMQLLIYLYIYFKSYDINSPTTTTIGIVSPDKNEYNSVTYVPINFFYDHDKEIKKNITYNDYIKNFLPFLINRISEIINPEIPIIENLQKNY